MTQYLLVLALFLSTYAGAVENDPYQGIFNSVDRNRVLTYLKEMSGVMPVTVRGKTFSISERYSPEGKLQFRTYWMEAFRSMGIDVQELAYETEHHSNHETQGHNLEAVLPGKSKDSFVIIVHYDSIGPMMQETTNPGVDDDMSGMAVLMETAKTLSAYKGKLDYTVRFVAADYEEWSDPGLEGARKYAAYLKDLSAKDGFKIIGAVDDEQAGWNCARDGKCDASVGGKEIVVASCADKAGNYNFKDYGDHFEQIAKKYSDLKINRICEDDDSDHFAMWEIGVPAVVFSEPYGNPQFDQNGGDTFDRIDQDYFYKLAQLGVVFAAEMAGVPAN
jgi:Zn-dependent M28 family amino/carboxypeptidase